MKTWFITGISRGFGKALAEAALARGDTVVGTVRDTRPDIAPGSGTLHVLTLDVTHAAAVEPAVAEAFALASPIDVVVNNAGSGLLGAFEAVSDVEIARQFETNVFSLFRVTRAALPRLRAQGSGHIVNITSIAGRAPNAGSVVYAATKMAVEGMSAALAQEVEPLGIKVTTVAPGAFRTDFLSQHSIRKSAVADTYAGTVGKVVDRLDAMAGRQLGDPARAADAILALVDSPKPPRQLLLGSDALRRARETLDATQAEIAAWESVTSGTDFPG